MDKGQQTPIFELDLTPTPKEPVCKGVFARYRLNTYVTTKGVFQTQSYQILKRKSCAGCRSCGALIDDMGEGAWSGHHPHCYTTLEDGDLVQLRIEVTSTDWETGWADDWCVYATKVTPSK